MMPSELLLKAILGTLTSEEAEELRVWREADEANELLYQQTTDTGFLQREYTKRQTVSHARPLAEMQSRIQRIRPLYRRPAFLRVAAVIAALLITGVFAYLWLNNDPFGASSDIDAIRPGNTMATLQVFDGEKALSPALPVRTQEAVHCAPFLTGRAGGESSAPTLSLVTPRGGEFRVTLEDGTEVWLNAQSQLVYPETFSETERRVKVQGEAYFKVAHNEEKPFLVETDGQLVRVLGTEFNVRSYAEDDAVQTTLVSGSIAMQSLDGGDAQLQLTPGHQALFDKAGHDIRVCSVDTEVVTSWREGKFVFENQTLQQIMLTLSRWYDFDYEFLDQSAAETEFMGRIPRYGDFADVIAILEGSGGLRFNVMGKKVKIETSKN